MCIRKQINALKNLQGLGAALILLFVTNSRLTRSGYIQRSYTLGLHAPATNPGNAMKGYLTGSCL